MEYGQQGQGHPAMWEGPQSTQKEYFATQSIRSTANCCRIAATFIDTSSHSTLPGMSRPKGASLLMTCTSSLPLTNFMLPPSGPRKWCCFLSSESTKHTSAPSCIPFLTSALAVAGGATRPCSLGLDQTILNGGGPDLPIDQEEVTPRRGFEGVCYLVLNAKLGSTFNYSPLPVHSICQNPRDGLAHYVTFQSIEAMMCHRFTRIATVISTLECEECRFVLAAELGHQCRNRIK
jgi:hypothetical protein